MMQTDVSMFTVSAGTVVIPNVPSRIRIKAVALTFTASAGALTISSSSGTLFSFTPAAAAGSLYMLLPGEGILADSAITVNAGAGTSATVFYG